VASSGTAGRSIAAILMVAAGAAVYHFNLRKNGAAGTPESR